MEARHSSLIPSPLLLLPSLFLVFLYLFFCHFLHISWQRDIGGASPTSDWAYSRRSCREGQKHRVLWTTWRVICFGEASRVGKWRLVCVLGALKKLKMVVVVGGIQVNRINQNANLHLSMHFYSFKTYNEHILSFTLFLLSMSLDKIKVFLVPYISLLS